jgi:hypothetical protein
LYRGEIKTGGVFDGGIFKEFLKPSTVIAMTNWINNPCTIDS